MNIDKFQENDSDSFIIEYETYIKICFSVLLKFHAG